MDRDATAAAGAHFDLPALGVAAARVALAGGRSLLHETSICATLGVIFGHFSIRACEKS